MIRITPDAQHWMESHPEWGGLITKIDDQCLLDEAPGTYKPIDVVLRDSESMLEVVHTLRPILNIKG